MKKQEFQPLTPAALYARVSNDRQDVDLSVAAQLRALRDFAKANVPNRNLHSRASAVLN